ncbi:MAG: type II secretion system F family protein [Acidobacteriia bacterium]|nr:type II secretion system F family protein [Terriglobia bacterium]
MTLLVFVSVAVVTALLGLRISDWRTRAVDRIKPRDRAVEPFIPSPSLIWQELVSRVGSLVPASPKDLPRLKRRLIRAGFRLQAAPLVFNGARVVSTVAFALLALVAGQQSHVAPGNLLYLTGGAAFLGYIAPMKYLSFRIRRRQRAIEKGLPNTLDLMVVCVESGLGLDQTTLQVAKELQFAYPEICEEFTVMNLEMRAGKRRNEALHNLAERAGVEELKKLVAVLIQTDRFGTSIAQSLRGHSDYMRVMARQRAEERAAKLAVKLVFPIFFCVLPSLFVVTVGPVLTKLVRDLLPMIENM